MPRFVVLEHDHPFLHWDLLLESGETALTWRLLVEPVSFDEPIEAEPLANHRLFYLDHEGPVSGDRGTVTRWDAGDHDVVESTPERVVVDLAGTRLRGRFRLRRSDDRSTWWFQRVESSET